MSVYDFPRSGVGPGSSQSPQSTPEIKPLYVTEAMVEMIEGWASNAAAHGNVGAWGVLSQCLHWRVAG